MTNTKKDERKQQKEFIANFVRGAKALNYNAMKARFYAKQAWDRRKR